MDKRLLPPLCLLLFFAFLLAIRSAPSATSSTQNGPDYIYLICIPDPAHAIKVSWHTDENYIGSVQYDTKSRGGTPGAYNYTAEGTGGVTTAKLEGYIHHVKLTDLEPDTIYYFICGNPESGWSEEYSFQTAPTTRENIRFVVGGDSRTDVRYPYPQWPWSRNSITKLMASYKPDFAIFDGDYLWSGQYEEKNLFGLTLQNYPDTWDNWLEGWFKFARAEDGRLIPLLPIIGNHEIVYPEPFLYDPETEATNFYTVFDLPENEEWYAWRSLNWGPDLHIIALDSEIKKPGSDIWKKQMGWLRQDLQEHYYDPWKIAIDHRPLGSISHLKKKDLTMEFDLYHLDIMFSGHIHTYVRSHPVNYLNPEDQRITEPENGTIYIVTGGWGAPLGGGAQEYTALGPLNEYHFTLVDILDNGMLHLRAINIDNHVIDDLIIQKELPAPTPPETSKKELPIVPIAAGVGIVGTAIVLFAYFKR